MVAFIAVALATSRRCIRRPGEPPLSRRRAPGGLMGEQRPRPLPWRPASRPPLLERGAAQSYWLGEKEIHVLHGASFALGPGEMGLARRPERVGKTTFCTWSAPSIHPRQDRCSMTGRTRSRWVRSPSRASNRNIGFVFIPLTVAGVSRRWKNTAMPRAHRAHARPEAERLARQMFGRGRPIAPRGAQAGRAFGRRAAARALAARWS